ncbi:MAG: hypothetical protein JO091_04730 [Acidobacteriaceae bacterium]|nr:hypothetical protein [Acidobacteriaceae bacterium]
MSITPQERARGALDALERSIIEVLATHPEGLSNAAIERELDIGSDRRGQQKGWLCWSILSRLLGREQIIKEGQQYKLRQSPEPR